MSIVFWRKMISNLEQFQTSLTKFKEGYLKENHYRRKTRRRSDGSCSEIYHIKWWGELCFRMKQDLRSADLMVGHIIFMTLEKVYNNTRLDAKR